MTRTNHKARPRVAVIGGGVIGLSIGWRLASGGALVDVFERGAAGRGASWAAAGMLAAGAEVEPGESALYTLLRRSQALWPDFAAALTERSGIDIQLRTEGTITVALTQDDAARLQQTYRLQQQLGVPAQWLSRVEALEREPRLNPRLAGAVLTEGDHQVDNRLVAEALKAAFLNANGLMHEQSGDLGIRVAGNRATGVTLGGGEHDADIVIVAAGAWSPDIAGLPAAARPPVRPIKGQMLALRMDPAAPLLRHVLGTPKAYLVPRRDGRLLIGATTEEKGFDDFLTAGGILSLLESAWRALPGIEELPLIESWVGFRPGSRDDAPILGPTPVDNLVLATGHHRNGILLAPVTAEIVARLVLEGQVDEALTAFSLARFAGSPERSRKWTSA